MHDYHKAADFLEEALTKLKETGKTRVTKIQIAVGDDSGYSGESIRMYFEQLAVGTACEKAEMTIDAVRPKLRCPNCGKLFERKRFHFECPDCGTEGEPSEIGREVKIEGIEME